MRAAWTRISLLPSAAEVRELLPPREAAKPRATHGPHCADCSGSCWKVVMVYEDLYKRNGRRAIRCDCNTCPHTTHKADGPPGATFLAVRVRS